MVLDARLVLADPARWNNRWTTEKEYADLRKYHCEGVFIESLRMRARRNKESVVEMTIRAKLRNPDGNHDKRVYLTYEILTEGQAIRTSTPSKTATQRRFEKENTIFIHEPLDGGVKVEESDAATAEEILLIAPQDLSPTSRLKITMALRTSS
jgi:hypothetical protein